MFKGPTHKDNGGQYLRKIPRGRTERGRWEVGVGREEESTGGMMGTTVTEKQ